MLWPVLGFITSSLPFWFSHVLDLLSPWRSPASTFGNMFDVSPETSKWLLIVPNEDTYLPPLLNICFSAGGLAHWDTAMLNHCDSWQNESLVFHFVWDFALVWGFFFARINISNIWCKTVDIRATEAFCLGTFRPCLLRCFSPLTCCSWGFFWGVP